MNKIMKDILLELYIEKISQRKLAEKLNVSLGMINKNIKELAKNEYLDSDLELTEKAIKEIKRGKPKNAIILAAGYGMRMVPINKSIPKGLLEVENEPLIERIIKQLNEKQITDIKIVVGFMKERYEYLIDKYNVELIVNSKYEEMNNLYSMYLAINFISNTYIIPCDIYCKINPFSEFEKYSWYMISDEIDNKSNLRINKKYELVRTKNNGNKTIGIAFIMKEDSSKLVEKLKEIANKEKYINAFWEEIFINDKNIVFKPKLVNPNNFKEINTYEDLRDLDENSKSLSNEAIEIIKEVFKVSIKDINNIQALKKGMTNNSFLFECNNQKYIMRIPGEGTDKLINREEEANVYLTIKDKKICDDMYYINPKNGYKITKYVNNARVCNPFSQEDITKCMHKLREFHKLNIKVEHEFNIYKQIDFYESLWNGQPSNYIDYKETKRKVLSLRDFIEKEIKNKCLTHIDAVPDNFLITNDEINLIDWEYAGMQDPDVDIAMFCIYALYDRENVDNLINIYFENECNKNTRIKIYAYIATCGLLWSNWCEFKKSLGVDFGEYSLKQYRYAKEYYEIVKKELKEGDIN